MKIVPPYYLTFSQRVLDGGQWWWWLTGASSSPSCCWSRRQLWEVTSTKRGGQQRPTTLWWGASSTLGKRWGKNNFVLQRRGKKFLCFILCRTCKIIYEKTDQYCCVFWSNLMQAIMFFIFFLKASLLLRILYLGL